MRRHKQELPKDKAAEILKQHNYGVLSLVDKDGIPYGVPINYAYADGRLLFHCAREGRKIDAIIDNPRASFCVIDKAEVKLETFSTDYFSVIAEGRIHIIDDADKEKAIREFMDYYVSRDFKGLDKEIKDFLPAVTMLEMCIDSISGKVSKSLVTE